MTRKSLPDYPLPPPKALLSSYDPLPLVAVKWQIISYSPPPFYIMLVTTDPL